MRRWSIGINSYHKTASYLLSEAPWYIFGLEDCVQLVCDILQSIPIINWRMPWEIDWSLADLFHCYVDMPIFTFCEDRTTCWCSTIDYDEALKRHPELVKLLE